MTPMRAFWRLDGAYPSRTAAERRARAIRWAPTVIERGLAVAVLGVMVGANDARLLRGPER